MPPLTSNGRSDTWDPISNGRTITHSKERSGQTWQIWTNMKHLESEEMFENIFQENTEGKIKLYI